MQQFLQRASPPEELEVKTVTALRSAAAVCRAWIPADALTASSARLLLQRSGVRVALNAVCAPAFVSRQREA